MHCCTSPGNRHSRFRQSGIPRHLFKNIVERCLAEVCRRIFDGPTQQFTGGSCAKREGCSSRRLATMILHRFRCRMARVA